MQADPPLYLASSSSYRAALLARLGLPFTAEAPGVPEEIIAAETPRMRALRLARAKAGAVAARHPEAWVLGSDQVAERDGRILEKPGDAARCREQLAACSGARVRFHTAAVLLRGCRAAADLHVDLTTVHFRQLDREAIARYVALERAYDCAGGFRCEGLGIALFETIENRDPTALIGLPLIWVAAALRRAGLDPLDAQS